MECTRLRHQINGILDTFTVRWRRNYQGVNLEHCAELLEYVSCQLGDWEVEKLIRQLKGKPEGGASNEW
jgi:hypothetical protein